MWPFSKNRIDDESEVIKVSISAYNEKINKLQEAADKLANQTLKEVLRVKNG